MKNLVIILTLLLTITSFATAQSISNLRFIEDEKPTPEGATTHIVEKGQTLYAISRKYQVSVAEIQKSNKLDGTLIKQGQRLNIYTEMKTRGQEDVAAAPAAPAAAPKPQKSATASAPEKEKPAYTEVTFNTVDEKDTPLERSLDMVAKKMAVPQKITIEKNIYHKVKSGDNLYNLSDTYEVSQDQLKNWNGTDVVKLGDMVIVGKKSSEIEVNVEQPARYDGTKTEVTTRSLDNNLTTKDYDNLNNVAPLTKEELGATKGAPSPTKTVVNNNNVVSPPSQFARGEINESGDYTTVADQNDYGTRFYAYHKTLPIGTKIKIGIPDNAGFVEVEVVGRMAKSQKAMIGLSPACVAIVAGNGNIAPVSISYDRE